MVSRAGTVAHTALRGALCRGVYHGLPSEAPWALNPSLPAHTHAAHTTTALPHPYNTPGALPQTHSAVAHMPCASKPHPVATAHTNAQHGGWDRRLMLPKHVGANQQGLFQKAHCNSPPS
jgi:hypothetical protein